MSNALHKAKVYFGLALEDEQPEAEVEPARPVRPTHVDEPAVEVPSASRGAEVTPLTRNRRIARVVPAPQEDELRRITTIHPKNYNDAKTIGENFREGIPVILNLTDLEDADAKRLVDFSAGLIFGLKGSIERVTSKVFLLSPATIEIASELGDEEETEGSRAFFNQS